MSDWWDDGSVLNLHVPEFPLRPTGILDGQGRMIFRKAVVGFTRGLEEYVVKDNEEIEKVKDD